MEHIINSALIVDEMELAAKRFAMITGKELSWEAIDKYVTEEPDSRVFCFDSKLKRTNFKGNDSRYAWIDTGARTDRGKPIFLSLVYRGEYYSGHFVGIGPFLMKGICDRSIYHMKDLTRNYQVFEKYHFKVMSRQKDSDLPDYRDSTDVENNQTADGKEITTVENCKKVYDSTNDNSVILSVVTEEIFANLMWPTWKSITGLDTYIKIIGRRISQIKADGRTEQYVENRIGNVVVNTGLMNRYGQDILVLYRKYLNDESYKAYKVMNSKSHFNDEGFTREQSMQELKPICFFNKEEREFKASFSDFDITYNNLRHIVEERKDRLPDSLRTENPDRIANIILDALRMGLKIQERDSGYAKPIYTDGRISWLLPLRIFTTINQEPELVLVIRNDGDYYRLRTILSYDSAMKDRITSLNLYRCLW